MIKLDSRAQLAVASAILIIFFMGLLFYYLDQANRRLTGDTNINVPTNSQLEVIASDGTVSLLSQSGQVIDQPSGGELPIRQVAQGPISNYRVISTAESYHIRYIKSDTGFIYDYYPQTNNEVRLTNTSLPRITNALWLADDLVYINYNNDGRDVNYLAHIDITNGSLDGQIFPPEISSIVASDDQILYLVMDDSGSSLYRYNANSGSSQFLLASDLQQADLLIDQETKEVYLASKINPSSSQVLYRVNPGTYRLELLPTRSQKGAGFVIASGTIMQLEKDSAKIYKQNESEPTIVGEIFSTAGKCQTASNIIETQEIICSITDLDDRDQRNWPFNWFMGQLKPSERIVSIDTNFGGYFDIIDLENVYDIEKLQVTPEYLYFISRRTGGLYEVFRGSVL